MGKIDQPDDRCTGDCSDELGNDIARCLMPRKLSNRSEGNCHRGVYVRTADTPDGIDGDRHSEPPTCRDHYPAGILPFAFGEKHIGHDPVAQNDQNHRPDSFRNVHRHDSPPSVCEESTVLLTNLPRITEEDCFLFGVQASIPGRNRSLATGPRRHRENLFSVSPCLCGRGEEFPEMPVVQLGVSSPYHSKAQIRVSLEHRSFRHVNCMNS